MSVVLLFPFDEYLKIAFDFVLQKLHCLHFCANAPKMSIFLGKPIKGATNMTSACIAKATFFASFHGLLHQSKYADVFKKCIFVFVQD